MTCRQAQSLLEDLADSELSSSLSSELHAHLQSCSECQREYERTLALKGLLSQRAAPDPGSPYFAEVTDLILARTAGSDQETSVTDIAGKSTSGPFFRSLLAAAASIAIFLTSVWFGSFQPMATADQVDLEQSQPANSLVAMVQADDNVIMNDQEKRRISSAVLLLGPPGMLGRGGELAGVLGYE